MQSAHLSTTFQKIYDFCKHLYENLKRIPKRDRYTWGKRIEDIALHVLTLAAHAQYLPKYKKKSVLQELSLQIDLIKIFLRPGNDLRILDDATYLKRSGEVIEMGKMTGKWLQSQQ